jgi:hypothetical protein
LAAGRQGCHVAAWTENSVGSDQNCRLNENFQLQVVSLKRQFGAAHAQQTTDFRADAAATCAADFLD